LSFYFSNCSQLENIKLSSKQENASGMISNTDGLAVELPFGVVLASKFEFKIKKFKGGINGKD